MAELSVLIAARNEMFLKRTVESVLAAARGDTDIIVVLDGAWADPPLEDHPRVTLIHRPIAIGQRAAVNLAAKVSSSRFVMKLDAHCSVDEGFDVKLMAADKELDRPDVTQIPAQYNLHAFNHRCKGCGTETYQGPTPTACATCSAKGTPGGPFEQVVYWDLNAGGVNGKPRRTEFWRFDHDLHFQYHGPRLKDQRHAELADLMSSVGACFFMRRSRFVEIGGLDEGHGSWGGFGTEISCKSWLSGGIQIVNRRTWFSHLFRTQGAGFSFPYPMRGSDQERAREYSRRLWLDNAWPGQTRPLSWLIEHFAPVKDWHDTVGAERLSLVTKAGAVFRSVRKSPVVLGVVGVGALGGGADAASSKRALIADGVRRDRQGVTSAAVGASGIHGGRTGASEQVRPQSDERDVSRVAAPCVVAHDVVEIGDVSATAHRDRSDQPGVDIPMREGHSMERVIESAQASVAALQGSACPVPTAGSPIDRDFGKDAADVVGREMSDCEKLGGSHASASSADVGSGAAGARTPAVPSIIPSKGLLYYSDCRGDERILQAVRQQLQRAAGDLPIVSVTLKAVDLGHNIVLPLERGQLTMFRQILTGLEALDTDVVFFVEHDVLYSPEHFTFTPPRRDLFYYNHHRWQVSAEDGRAVHYRCGQTAQLCADRQLLLEHYRRRIAAVEAAGGYAREMGYEPGTNKWARSIHDVGSETWFSTVPNIDIRHGANLSKTRWRQEDFRNKSTCQGWTESDSIPGWGRTRGRFNDFLADLGRTASATEGAA